MYPRRKALENMTFTEREQSAPWNFFFFPQKADHIHSDINTKNAVFFFLVVLFLFFPLLIRSTREDAVEYPSSPAPPCHSRGSPQCTCAPQPRPPAGRCG